MSGALIINENVTRPTPTGRWSHEWRRNPTSTSADGRETTYVFASYAADTPIALEADPDPEAFPEDLTALAIPNDILVRRVASHGSVEFRLTRDAARGLIEMLQSALDWDGR